MVRLGLAPTLQPWASFPALVVYCVLASSSYLAMEIYAVVRPANSQALLARSRAWIDAHTDQGSSPRA